MTLGEGKRKVYELLDEYSGGAQQVDADLEAKMADFFDIAQKKLAQVSRIYRTRTLERQSGITEYELPEDCLELCRVWRDGRPWNGFRRKADRLLVPERTEGALELEYAALPADISESTTDGYEFEVGEAAAQAMPFFVAAQVLSADLVQDAGTLLGLYQVMVSDLPGGGPGGLPRVDNSFYRA